METRTAILQYATNRDVFRFADLLSYLNKYFEISKVTLAWYLRRMVNENLLIKISRGIYTTQARILPEYTPSLSKTAISIGLSLKNAFPLVKTSIFDGEILERYQRHLSANNTIYVEAERDATEAIFHFLKKERDNVFINPPKEFVYDNIDLSKNNVIVKPLITESPLMEIEGIKTPRIEKILVDVLCDEDFFYLQGLEWHYMLENALNLVAITRSTMLRYASRRNVRTKIQNAIENINHD